MRFRSEDKEELSKEYIKMREEIRRVERAHQRSEELIKRSKKSIRRY